jgi:hypothetical protein
MAGSAQTRADAHAGKNDQMSEGLERSRAASNMLTNVGTAAQDMVGPRASTANEIQLRVRGPVRMVGLIDCAREGMIKYGPFRLVRLAARQKMFATLCGVGCKRKQASSLKLAQTLHIGIGKRPINILYPFRLFILIRFVCSVHKRIDANWPVRWKWSGV